MESSGDWGTSTVIVQTFGILLFVIFLIVAVFWLVRKMGISRLMTGNGSNSRIRLLNRIPIGPKQSLIVAEILSRIYVLGVGEQSVQTIAGPFSREEWETDDEPQPIASMPRSGFQGLLQKALGKK